MALLEDIEAMARIDPAFPTNPFFRRAYGQWVKREMQSREGLYAAVLDIFRGETWKYIDPMPSESISEARARVGKYERPLLRSFMNKWNTLYTQEPTRVFFHKGKRLTEKDELLQILQDQYMKSHINDIMEQADTLLRLTGTIALRPWYDSDHDELVLHVYSANNIRPIVNRNNPKRPLAIALVGRFIEEGTDGGAMHQTNAEYFTPEKMGTLINGKRTVEDLETDKPPIILGFDKYPTNKSGFFVDSPGPALAALDRLFANDFTSQLGFVTLMQGFGIPVTWGLPKGVKLRVGPDRTVDFDGDLDRKEDLEFKSTNAPLDDITNVIQRMIDWTREDYDIPRSMLDVSMSSSGVAQVEAMAPVGMMREKRTKQMRPIERQSVQRIVDVLQAAGVISQSVKPEDFEVAVHYPDPQITKSTTDQIAQDRFELEWGITSAAKIMMRDSPDEFDSEEEAAEFIAERGGMLAQTVAEGGSEPTPGSPAVQGDDPPTAVETPAVDGDGVSESDPASEAMNGAQVTALQGLVEAVSGGTMPAESAALVVRNAFPTIPEADIKKMFDTAEAFDPKADDTVSNAAPPTDNPGEVIAKDNPFEVQERDGKFLVVKTEDGKVFGTHNTKEEAMEQFKALEAKERE